MATNYLALRSSAAVNLTISTLTGSTITAPTATVSTLMGSTLSGLTMTLSTLTGSTITVSTLFGSTITGSTITVSSIIARGLVLSTLAVSSINNAVPGTFSTLTVSSLVSVSSIQTASTMYTSSLVTTGSVGIGTAAPLFTFDVASSSQNTADLTVLSNTTYGSFGQTWTTISGPPSAVWNGVAISATGQYQTAVYGSYSAASGVYYSNNYGSTWTAVTIPTSQQYQTVAMSASGQYQVTGVNGNGGKIYVSTDYGVTWNVVSSSYTGLWNGFGVSSTGQYMVGVLYYYSSFLGTIYYSSDYGVTWTQGTGLSSTTLLFTGVCCSGSGQYQTACANGSGLWYSSNYGASWTLSTSSGARVWVGACCSLSGQYQSACVLNGSIYYSSDYGVTWTSSGVANAAWQDICCDSTAQYQLCTVSVGKIWYSANYGQSWTVSNSATGTWGRPRMSRYGQYSIANVNNGTLASSNLSSVNQPFLRLGCGSSGNQTGIILNTWNARPGGPSCQVMSMDDGGFSSHMAFFTAASGSAGYTVSTERLRITANGSVGIGTNAPAEKLTVQTATANYGVIHTDGTIIVGTFVGGSSVAGWFGTKSNHPLNFFTNNSSARLTIDTSGNVGIGTTGPGYLLDIYGSNPTLRIRTSTGAYSSGTATLLFDSITGSYPLAKIAGIDMGISPGVFRSDLAFYYQYNTTLTEGMRLASNGYVGIGTANPISPLHVMNGIISQGSSNSNFVNVTANNGNYGSIESYNSTNTVKLPLVLQGYGGNVGIGTATPSHTLQVAGAINCTSFLVNGTAVATGTGSVWGVNGSTAYYTSGNVGISTTDPQNNKLRVFGGNANSGISLGDFMTSAGVKYIGMTAVSDGTIVSTSSGFSGITWGAPFDGGTSGYLAFHTHGYGITSGERMRIDKDGRVGIGTNAPLCRLMVHAFGDGVSTTNWIAGAFGPSASLPRVVLGTYGSNAIIGAHNSTLDAWANLTINPGGNVTITGTLSKGGGSFDIHHPLFTDAKKRLVHSFVEGPRCDLIYRGKTTLVNGTAMVDINKECTHSPECAMDDGTFEALCGNPQIFLQNNQSFDRVRGAITGSRLTITCENPVSIVIEWMVIAERVDPFIKKWDRTNSDGYLVTQYTMDHEPLNMATNYD